MSVDQTDPIAAALKLWRQDSSELADATDLAEDVIAHAVASGDASALLATDDLALRFHAVLRVRVVEAERVASCAANAAEAVLHRFIVDE